MSGMDSRKEHERPRVLEKAGNIAFFPRLRSCDGKVGLFAGSSIANNAIHSIWYDHRLPVW